MAIYVSNCCGEVMHSPDITDICPRCFEHATPTLLDASDIFHTVMIPMDCGKCTHLKIEPKMKTKGKPYITYTCGGDEDVCPVVASKL